MNAADIASLLRRRAFPGPGDSATLVETHASWVILTPQFAYKIKKPIQLSFLDFSTIERRRFFCEEELRLNRRFSPGVYLSLLPVRQTKHGPAIAAPKGPIVDYALQMRRMDEQRQLDLMLKKNQVEADDLCRLADEIALFHQRAEKAPRAESPAALAAAFADLNTDLAALTELIDADIASRVKEMSLWAADFLGAREAWFEQRFREGMVVDGHGDLHTRNIFMSDIGPVLFDCIEFSAEWRNLDLLNEIGFLCMDLDVHGRGDLVAPFLERYLKHIPAAMKDEDDRLMFDYYRLYRANVRLKVLVLLAAQFDDAPRYADARHQARAFWKLMDNYFQRLKVVPFPMNKDAAKTSFKSGAAW
jgi:aminoglycoside phosphotransferase family enzyme